MSPTLALVIGVGIGFAAATMLIQPGNCCERVGVAVAERVGEELGGTAQTIFEAVGGKKWAPGVLNLFGA